MIDASIRAVAEAVVELMIERGLIVGPGQVADERILDAAAAARLLGRSRQWVYEHADDLGAFRYGSGPRARLGFDRSALERWKHQRQQARTPTKQGVRNATAQIPAARGANLIPFEPL
jgi:predicted DNA-binding transcriptional regulator AlpA